MLEVPCLDPNYSVLEGVPVPQRSSLLCLQVIPVICPEPCPWLMGHPTLRCLGVQAAQWLAEQSYLLASRQDELWCHVPSGAQDQAEASPRLRWHPCWALSPSLSCSPHSYRLTWESFLIKSLALEFCYNQGTRLISACIPLQVVTGGQ